MHLAALASLRGARSAALSIAALTAVLVLSACPGPKETEFDPLTGNPDGGAGQADAGPPPTFASSLDALSLDYDESTKKWTVRATYLDGESEGRLEASGTLDAAQSAALTSDDATFGASYAASLSCSSALCDTGMLRLTKKTGALAGAATVSITRVKTKAVSAAWTGELPTGSDAFSLVAAAFKSLDPREGTVTLLPIDGGHSFFSADIHFRSTAPRTSSDFYDRRTVSLRGPLGAATRMKLGIVTTVGGLTQDSSTSVAGGARLEGEGTAGPVYVTILPTDGVVQRKGLAGLGFIW